MSRRFKEDDEPQLTVEVRRGFGHILPLACVEAENADAGAFAQGRRPSAKEWREIWAAIAWMRKASR